MASEEKMMMNMMMVIIMAGVMAILLQPSGNGGNGELPSALTVKLANSPQDSNLWQIGVCDWDIAVSLGQWGFEGENPPDNITLTAEFEVPAGVYLPLRITHLSVFKWNVEHTALIGLYEIQSMHELQWDWDAEAYTGDPDPSYRDVSIPAPGNYLYNMSTEEFEVL